MKAAAISLLAAVIIIGGIYVLTDSGGVDAPVPAASGGVNNVGIVGGVQIVEITARGGYKPRVSLAQAGMPTTIRFDGRGSFDCSSAVRIPSLGISKTLAYDAVTDIDVGVQQVGTLKGSCGMGMYPFEIQFK